jgi:hypothetical protein
MSQNKVAEIEDYERTIRKDSDVIMQQEVWTKYMDCDIQLHN